MNSDVALIMLDIPVVQCGSVNAEGNFLSPQPCFSNRGRDLINTCPYLIFVTNFTCETCGEKSAMWRNFRFLYMANGEKSEKCSGMLDFST